MKTETLMDSLREPLINTLNRQGANDSMDGGGRATHGAVAEVAKLIAC